MKAGKIMLIGLIFIIIPILSLQAQIPQTISYQGVLTDENGDPLADGQYSMLFALYISSTGGTAIWSETKSLDVSGGLFNTYLGDQVEFGNDIQFNQPYWLGITVGAGPELTSRIPLSSVGYSFYAMRADTAKYVLNSAAGPTGPAGGDLAGQYPNPSIAADAINGFHVDNNAYLQIANIEVISTGGPDAGHFEVDNTSSSANALYVTYNGTNGAIFAKSENSEVAFFTNNNSANATDVLKVRNSGNGDAIDSRNTGTGRAGYFVIENTGNTRDALYVGTTGSGRAAFFSGDIWVNGTASAVSHPNISDAKFKKNIKSIESSLDKALKLRGVRFRWKRSDFPEMDFEEGDQIGFIAQEVETILPEIVVTDRDGNKSVDYSKVTAVLIEAVKEQQSLINDLNKRIEYIEKNLSNHSLVKINAETFSSSNGVLK